MPRTGRCLCGEISYEIATDPLTVVLCHCDDCQRQSGTAFSVNAVVPAAALTVTGTPRDHRTTSTDDGQERRRQFCGSCGSPLFTLLAEQPGLVVVKAGTLDDRTDLRPAAEVWWGSSQGWVDVAADQPRFERGMPES